MNIAIFGGSFNPVHNGHLNLAMQIKEEIGIDRVILVPTAIPPHKSGRLASDSDRLAMCKLAIDGLDGFEVSDFEILKGTVSYTVETLRYFRKKFPNDSLNFIMGSDMLASFKSWRNFEEILSLATILVGAREENEVLEINRNALKLKKYGGNVVLFTIKPYVISSTRIRALIKRRQDFTCYLPEKVVQYIKDRELFGGSAE